MGFISAVLASLDGGIRVPRCFGRCQLRVKVALKACELLDGGAHMGGASTYIVTALDDHRENAGYLAAWFAQDAVMTFCPDTRTQWRCHAVSTFDEQN